MKDLQGSTTKRVKGVEDLNIGITRAQGIVGVGASDGTEGGHADGHDEWNTCPCCGGRMIIIETFEPGCQPRLWPLPSIGLDSS